MNRQDLRLKRKTRMRSKVKGDESKPRLSVFRSNKHIFAQLIDDETSKTLAAASDVKLKDKNKKADTAFTVGENLAKAAKLKKIDRAVFDRNGYKYHGRVKSLAEGARKGGLSF